MKIKLETDKDISDLTLEEFDNYFVGFLNFYVEDGNNEILLFSTTLYTTFLNEFNDILIDMYKSPDCKKEISTIGNANLYTLKRKREVLEITEFNQVSETIDGVYEFNFFDFLGEYTERLEQHLIFLQNTNSNIVEEFKFNLLKNELIQFKQLGL
ncbi:hypothetical protein [Solibacillus sp. FSL H8-0538]|uniref:hypothetical protein n=1 Tax=Solibacillus sp. FSL H8-0538 TaxID=2921400 RepID=UPI0030F902C3